LKAEKFLAAAIPAPDEERQAGSIESPCPLMSNAATLCARSSYTADREDTMAIAMPELVLTICMAGKRNNDVCVNHFERLLPRLALSASTLPAGQHDGLDSDAAFVAVLRYEKY
jgi:hypothetical protein